MAVSESVPTIHRHGYANLESSPTARPATVHSLTAARDWRELMECRADLAAVLRRINLLDPEHVHELSDLLDWYADQLDEQNRRAVDSGGGLA